MEVFSLIFAWLRSQGLGIGHPCDLLLRKLQISYLCMHWGTKDTIWGAGLKKPTISAHLQWNRRRTCNLFNKIDGVPVTGSPDGSRTVIGLFAFKCHRCLNAFKSRSSSLEMELLQVSRTIRGSVTPVQASAPLSSLLTHLYVLAHAGASQAFFWYDNDKNLTACFCVTWLTCQAVLTLCTLNYNQVPSVVTHVS